MKEVKLIKGKVALVDDDLYPVLSQYSWREHLGYAYRRVAYQGKSKPTYMHWDVIGKPLNGLITKHINGNTLDNRRENLIFCTVSESGGNRKTKQANSTSGYKGVTWRPKKNKWEAQIWANKKYHSLGLYATKEKAAIAYNEAAMKYHGQFARLNEI